MNMQTLVNSMMFGVAIVSLLLTFFSFGATSHFYNDIHEKELYKCQDSCVFTLVESVPEGLDYPHKAPIMMSTYDAHKRMLKNAKKTIHLASFYWTLLGKDILCNDTSCDEGADIYKSLHDIVEGGDIEVKIAQNNTNEDTDKLAKAGAQVRTLDFQRLMNAGVMHTKMWVVDDLHVYIGSGNYDWRSYTQTKETGVLIENCPCLGSDAAKLFEVYWYLGDSGASIPKQWPKSYSTSINATSPALIHYNDTKGLVYLSSSPPPFCPGGRSVDIDAIVNVIRSAKKFIYISVMDYLPQIIYTYPEVFWPVIDNELRAAALDRKVQVFLMASHWEHTMYSMYPFLRSLADLGSIKYPHVDLQVKLFTVPSYTKYQESIPFARVDHSKYMVTDQHAYIGTSNWAGDYFKSTAGVGFILLQPDNNTTNAATSLRSQLEQVFLRDWNSIYTKYVL